MFFCFIQVKIAGFTKFRTKICLAVRKRVLKFAAKFQDLDFLKMKKFFFAFLLAMFCLETFGQKLPDVKLKDINGKEVSTAELSNDGKPFIISFFATWCKPCNRELSAISDVYEEWQEETGVKLIAISVDQAHNVQKVRPLVENNGWEYDVLLDPNSDFLRAMNVKLIPHVFVVDGEGNVVFSRSGYTDGGEEELIEKVREFTK